MFVRELNHTAQPMFHYNIHDLKVDDCRNSSDNDCYAGIIDTISKNEDLFLTIMRRANQAKHPTVYLEHKIWDYHWYNKGKSDLCKFWKKHFDHVYVTNDSQVYGRAIKKNKNVWHVSHEMYGAITSYLGGKDAQDLLSLGEKKGVTYCKSPSVLLTTCDRDWETCQTFLFFLMARP